MRTEGGRGRGGERILRNNRVKLRRERVREREKWGRNWCGFEGEGQGEKRKGEEEKRLGEA